MTYEEVKEKRESVVSAVLELQELVRKASHSITDKRERKALLDTYQMCDKFMSDYVTIID